MQADFQCNCNMYSLCVRVAYEGRQTHGHGKEHVFENQFSEDLTAHHKQNTTRGTGNHVQKPLHIWPRKNNGNHAQRPASARNSTAEGITLECERSMWSKSETTDRSRPDLQEGMWSYSRPDFERSPGPAR